MTARFRYRDGRLRARLGPVEVTVLRRAVVEVIALLEQPAVVGGPAADPVRARLLPDGYRDDPAAAAEFRQLTEETLRADKLAAAARLLEQLPDPSGEVRLDRESADSWLEALNDARLTLGTRLEVTEETDVHAEIAAAPAAPRSYALSGYGYLTYLQESLVQALRRAG